MVPPTDTLVEVKFVVRPVSNVPAASSVDVDDGGEVGQRAWRGLQGGVDRGMPGEGDQRRDAAGVLKRDRRIGDGGSRAALGGAAADLEHLARGRPHVDDDDAATHWSTSG